MTNTKFDLYSEITNKIIKAIEDGAGELVMPWHKTAAGLPINATTRKNYRGINVLLLWMTADDKRYPSAHWATFKQWKEIGATVRKGERGTPIIFFKMLNRELEPSPTGEEITAVIPFARASWVFNAAQVEGYTSDEPIDEPIKAEQTEFELIEAAERQIRATGANIQYGGSRACYLHKDDLIQVPNASDFISTPTSSACEGYYSTIFHELAHWTGAPHRLDRTRGKKFADRPYCFEEIIAELSAAFSCVKLGVNPTPRADHAQYIEQYLKLLKADKRAIVTAASAAAAATDYILGNDAMAQHPETA